MEVHFTPEQETQLAQVAANSGTDPERLVQDAVFRLLPGSKNAGSEASLSGDVVAAIRTLRARLQPDPEGWTTRDYILYGRR